MNNHGMSNTRLYGVWGGMKDRCYNKNNPGYHHYGGRGIVVCDEWKNDFMSFYKWAMANGYDETAPRGQCTIERNDNDGPYSPDNCRWATIREQEGNKRNTLRVKTAGEEVRLVELAEREGVKYSTALKRITRRKRGVISREEYLAQTQKEKQPKIEAARKALAEKPDLSIRALAREIGVPKTTAERLKKAVVAGLE